MFEPAKNSKAPDCSEALILLGRDGEITFGDLVEGWPQHKAVAAARKTGFFVGRDGEITFGDLVEGWPQHKAVAAARKTGFFIRAAFQPLVGSGSNKKALDFV